MADPVDFTVSVPDPRHHLLKIRMEVPDVEDRSQLDLCLPVWSPGSYKVREYARHLQNFAAAGPEGGARDSRKIDKATWRVDCSGVDRIAAEYEIYAHTLNVREKHVDASHAFFQPTAVFLYPDGELDRPATLELEPPNPEWQTFCGLDRIDGDELRRRASNFDVLYDAPVEMGDHDVLEFDAEGVPHEMVFWGAGNWDPERLERDLPEIVSAHTELFDEIPYDEYTFIALLSDGAYGGLEHRNSTSLLYPQNEFGAPPEEDAEPPIHDDDYLNFLSLVSHELFHAWNVKRMYPAALEDFDYQSEQYVPELWTIEGITSFYDRRALFRADLIDADRYLEYYGDRIASYENTPGRHVQSLREAGFDAWVKLYLSDEQTVNSTVSYYLEGALVAFVLDLRIRRATDGAHSLDDVVRHLWREYGPTTDRGYPDGIYRELTEEYAGRDFGDFFDQYVWGTAEFDWRSELAPFGLLLERELAEESPETWLGVECEEGDDGATVARVRSDGPARDADLSPGDEITAIDGWRIDGPDDLRELLRDAEVGDELEVVSARRGRIVPATVSVEQRPPDEYRIRRMSDLDVEQREQLDAWLGTTDIERAEAG